MARGPQGHHTAPTYPKHRHITHTDVLFTMGRALQVQQQPGGAVDRDVGHHREGIPVGERRLSMSPQKLRLYTASAQ